MTDLKGKNVLITGASSGIGTATARAFAEKGANLILAARRAQRLEELAAELREQHGVQVAPVPMDVRDYAGVKQGLDALPAELTPVDILINNAGLSMRGDKVQDAKVENFDVMVDTNIKGMYNTILQVLPGMMARNSGHIINIGSIAGLNVYPTGSMYCASKAAVKTFTEGLRLDIHTSDIRVSLIEPGMTATEFMTVKFGEPKDYYGGVEALTAEDMADTILYCASAPAHVNVTEMVVMPTHQASFNMIYRRGQK